MLNSDSVISIFSFSVLIGDIALVLFALFFLLTYITRQKKFFRQNPFVQLVAQNGRVFAFASALGATLGSLFMSEIILLEPCKLCWYQRIFMYPLPFLLGMAIIKDDKKISDYILMISGVGIVIAFYHFYLQNGGVELVSCTTTGGPSCSGEYLREFGYITIPVMSITAFVGISVLMLLYKIIGRNIK